MFWEMDSFKAAGSYTSCFAYSHSVNVDAERNTVIVLVPVPARGRSAERRDGSWDGRSRDSTRGAPRDSFRDRDGPRDHRSDVCYSFQNSGSCKFGDRCRYSHGPSSQRSGFVHTPVAAHGRPGPSYAPHSPANGAYMSSSPAMVSPRRERAIPAFRFMYSNHFDSHARRLLRSSEARFVPFWFPLQVLTRSRPW